MLYKFELGKLLTLHAEWLADPNKGRQANLRNADLRHADLRDVNLRGASLRYANLRGADLRGANLTGVDLNYTDLGNANLRDAILTDSHLYFPNLTDADLTGAIVDKVAWVESNDYWVYLRLSEEQWVALHRDSTYTLPAEWQVYWELFK